ncbi:MAG: hypothetical protein RLZZ158_1981, partial [Cyanobacteriota bacterium]
MPNISVDHSFLGSALLRVQGLSQRLWQRIPLMDRWLLAELIAPLLFGVAA